MPWAINRGATLSGEDQKSRDKRTAALGPLDPGIELAALTGGRENPIRKIAGGSEKPREGKKLIQQIAAIEVISGKESAAILLSGATGTGKE